MKPCPDRKAKLGLGRSTRNALDDSGARSGGLDDAGIVRWKHWPRTTLPSGIAPESSASLSDDGEFIDSSLLSLLRQDHLARLAAFIGLASVEVDAPGRRLTVRIPAIPLTDPMALRPPLYSSSKVNPTAESAVLGAMSYDTGDPSPPRPRTIMKTSCSDA